MKLLIIGASGLVGEALYKEALKKGHSVLGTYYDYPQEGLQRLDYGNHSGLVKILDSFLPDCIICPAAKSSVDWVEENPKEAWKINVNKLNNLFETASERNIPVAFFSSDYIFDGTNGPYSEDSKPNPINYYGSHKLAAEIMLKSMIPKKHFIFRTAWVFGQERKGKNFLFTVIKNLSMNKEMKVQNDFFATPSYSNDVAKFAISLIEKNSYGTYNLTNDQQMSRLDFAKHIANCFELNNSLLQSTSHIEIPLFAKRPLRAGLINQKVTKETSLTWTPLDAALLEVKELMKKTGQFPIVKKDSSSKICIFIPCYNAAVTLPKVLERIPAQIKEKVQEIFVVDNASDDYTYLLAIGYREKHTDIKNLKIFKNAKNFGYGGNQKLAYAYAIKQGYDMVVMLHGDAQYAPEKLPVMIEAIEKDPSIDLLFGSRMTGDPLAGGMPLHRYIGNKVLTFLQNILLKTKISEFHSGYRIFRTSALKQVPFHLFDNYYHFDTEIIIQFINKNLKIAEVPIDTYYGTEKCYVNIWKYGIQVLIASFCYFLHTKGIRKYELYNKELKADTENIFRELKTEIY